MLAEYDFSNAVRGKYYESYRQGTNVVLLDADVAEVFPSAAAVNDALRLLVALRAYMRHRQTLVERTGTYTQLRRYRDLTHFCSAESDQVRNTIRIGVALSRPRA